LSAPIKKAKLERTVTLGRVAEPMTILEGR
jgi:hypothetical protein